MKFLKKLFFKIFSWVKSLFFTSKKEEAKARDPELIGTAVFDSQRYLFVRRERDVFLVSDTDNHHYSRKIFLPRLFHSSLESLRDINGITIGKENYLIVATITLDGLDKTICLRSDDARHFELQSMLTSPEGAATKVVVNDKNEIFLLTSVNGEICYQKLEDQDSQNDYHKTNLGPRHNSFDHGPLKMVGASYLDDGIFVIYEVSYDFPGYQTHRFGAALLAHDNLAHVHWRAADDEIPFWEHFVSRADSNIDLQSLGAYFNYEDIKIMFFDKKHRDVYSVDLHQPYARRYVHKDKAHLKKYVNNPILKPKSSNSWECNAVFNPTAIELDGIIHMLYRAEGSAGLSVIGYGKSHNGITFDRLADPIYLPRMNFEGVGAPTKMVRRGSFKSGYNHYPVGEPFDWHGVEDPRITELDGRLYMIYAAYNGYQMARPAITSIAKEDFLSGKWDWKTPQPMTEQAEQWGGGNKNVVLFPEKRNGKFMLFHRIWPHIRIDYVDDLEFGPGKQYLKELNRISARGDSWDSNRVGVSSAPIRIKEGWLMIYQGAGSQDRQYKVGAMILDHDDPSKVLYRSSYPIMVPTEWYENEHKFGVAYPCGAVVKDDMLNVYYGGSDKYVCLAQAPLQEFVDKLKQDPYREVTLEKRKNIKELCI